MSEKSDWEQGYDQAQRRFYEERKVLNARIAELEAEIERLTVHSDIERQDDKSPNDTQTQTIVYGKWIPVSERLPENRATVLAAFENREILTATYYKHHEGFGGVENYWHIEGWHSGNVTHWMPLPPNPEVQE